MVPSRGRRVLRAVADSLCAPAVGEAIGRLFPRRVRSRGCVLDVAHEVITPHTRAALFWGLYERWERRFATQYVPRQYPVVELGASIGAVSATLARRIDPGMALVCVEMNPALLPVLRSNVSLNGRPDATIVNAAIDYAGPVGGSVLIQTGADHLVTHVSEDGATDGLLAVPRTTLRELLERHGLRRFALVCDIEGSEAGLLEDEGESLRMCDAAVFELHATRYRGRMLTVEELATQVERSGLRRVARHGPVFAFVRESPP